MVSTIKLSELPDLQQGKAASGTVTWSGAFVGNVTGNVTGNGSIGKLTNLLTNGLVSTSSSDGTLGVTAVSVSANSTVVLRDGSGDFSAGTITATLNGTATRASEIASANETTDTTCFPAFFLASGTQIAALNTNPALTYNASTNDLGIAKISGIASLTMGTAAGTVILKQGANGKTGTFVANGATPVSVATTAFTANSGVIFTLKTVGGTITVYPVILTVTPGTGFTVVFGATDTSTYNYHIIESAA